MGGFTAVRLDADTFPVVDFERKLMDKAGISELIEVRGDLPEEIEKAARDADVIYIVSARVGRGIIEKLDRCRILCRIGTGTDKIDLEAATEKGIIVTNVPDFCVNEMADHAMALLLSAARKLPVMSRHMREGTWIQAKNTEKVYRIAGKKLGLIGFGNVGKEIAVRAKGFKMEVMDYHRNVNPEVEKSYGVEPVSLERLLKESDYVIVCCPLTAETRGMLGKKELLMLKESAILVNIARGPIVDEMALAEILKEKRIAGAGIDVFEHINIFKEPDKGFHSPFFDLDNAMLTPHMGAMSVEALEECLIKANEEVARVLKGVWPLNCVNTRVKPWFDINR